MNVITSDTELANMALGHLGQSPLSGDLESDRSNSAKVMRTFFETTRGCVLRDFPWGFAQRLVTLAPVEEDPNSEWGFSYRMPVDCFMPRRIPSGIRNETLADRIPYRTIGDDSGTLILTDQEDAELEYTARVTNPALYPADFCMAFSLRLAAYGAPLLTSGDKFQLGTRAYQLYMAEIARAKANNANESVPDYPPDSEFISVRG